VFKMMYVMGSAILSSLEFWGKRLETGVVRLFSLAVAFIASPAV
jgi:hypothetical protein